MENYKNALIEVRDKCLNNEKISFTRDIAVKHGVFRNIRAVLIDLGYIKKLGNLRYKWLVGDYIPVMAKRVKESCVERQALPIGDPKRKLRGATAVVRSVVATPITDIMDQADPTPISQDAVESKDDKRVQDVLDSTRKHLISTTQLISDYMTRNKHLQQQIDMLKEKDNESISITSLLIFGIPVISWRRSLK
jgi:hypothetical protein